MFLFQFSFLTAAKSLTSLNNEEKATSANGQTNKENKDPDFDNELFSSSNKQLKSVKENSSDKSNKTDELNRSFKDELGEFLFLLHAKFFSHVFAIYATRIFLF